MKPDFALLGRNPDKSLGLVAKLVPEDKLCRIFPNLVSADFSSA